MTENDIRSILSDIDRFNAELQKKYGNKSIRVSLMPKTDRKFRLIADQGMRCQYCGSALDISSIEIDHRVPVSQGGKTTLDNLAVSCIHCNRTKSNKTAAEFIDSRRK